MTASRVLTGLERVTTGDATLRVGRRVGLIGNPTSVDSGLRHAADILQARDDIELTVLFGPEHGLRGDAQDMIAVDTERDARTGLPVYSLYGHDEDSLTPPPDSLAGLDAVIFDIQDVGSRYYTYVWTLLLCMRACARAGVAVVVLDRPNPIAGTIEGGGIQPGYESFVGLSSLPNRHGLTAGEVARGMLARERLDLDLHVIAMRGWQRSMYYEDTGLPWVLPSPNMPTRDTALVYPGMCLVEGTELSEGRGTTRPFELVGAPFCDARRLADELDRYRLPGLAVRATGFRPTFQKHAGALCGGVQLHVTDREAFRPYLTGVAFLCAVHALWPEQFAWRRRAYEFVDTIPAIDLLAGSDRLRTGIEAGVGPHELAAEWAAAEREFAEERRAWLLYPDGADR